ncbi:hypothetical protein [Clostridium arbusti]|uniref:hypothetical protein n=1 Tax=Clostridium arbusti TaxID=1137848 RepID=UPI0002897213|nr:hypothetical protein [Clostridium arbusti]
MEDKVLNVEEVQAAQDLHKKILNSGKIAAQALVEFSLELKQMRDTRLYQVLGYNIFADYCEQSIYGNDLVVQNLDNMLVTKMI